MSDYRFSKLLHNSAVVANGEADQTFTLFNFRRVQYSLSIENVAGATPTLKVDLHAQLKTGQVISVASTPVFSGNYLYLLGLEMPVETLIVRYTIAGAGAQFTITDRLDGIG